MLNKRQQNKIKTAGYFIKRLRDSGFCVLRIFDGYSSSDSRRWTVLLDPGDSSIYITCYNNKNFNDEIMFEFNSCGEVFAKNFSIQTESIEVIVQLIIDKGIRQMNTDSLYYKNTKIITTTQQKPSTDSAT